MVIYAKDTDQLITIVAGLVERGLHFSAKETTDGWKIELTGGF
tara:strand:+ start:922 stop:1050 length:129 start_codon:yes stop_codon:yes gene_type:complete